MKKFIFAASVIFFCVLSVNAYAAEDALLAPDPDRTDAVGFKYCFSVGSTSLFLDYNGQFISGVAENPTCGTGFVAGDVIGRNFVIYRDWTSASCTEGVWYTGNLSGFTYEWFRPEDGVSGTGTMTKFRCP